MHWRLLDGINEGMRILKQLTNFTLGIIILLLSGQGCTEDPTSVGSSFLRPIDIPQVKIDTLYAASHSTTTATIFTSTSDRILLGKFSSYDALVLLRFNGLQSGLLDTVKIAGARIQLRVVYHFGDSLAPLAFSTYKAIANWDSATYDSLTLLPGNYYSSTPYSVIPPTILGDTSTVECAVDTGDVHDWFTALPRSPNNGVIFRPSNVSTIKGFGSFVHATTEYRPKLIVTYLRNNVPDSLTFSSGISRYVANIPQTSLVLNSQLFYAQCGVSYRGVLNFNMDTLPKAAMILKAELDLSLDAASSVQNSFTVDTLYPYYVRPDGGLVGGVSYQSQTIVVNSQRTYVFPIRDFVRAWANGATVRTIQIGGRNETNSLDLFAVYGTTAIAGLRPRLIITYSYSTQ
jgi:hypothetical protein